MATKMEDSYGTECKLFRVTRTVTYFLLAEAAPEVEDLVTVESVVDCNGDSVTSTSIHEVKSLVKVTAEERELSVYEAGDEFASTMEEYMEAMGALSALDGEEG
jgi:hypothetical protein